MRSLSITDYGTHVTIQNSEGVQTTGKDMEDALVRFSHRYALELSEVRSGYDCSQVFDTLLGTKHEGTTGTIHEGVQTG